MENWRTSVVRRQELVLTLWISQASSLTSWSIQNCQNCVPCGLWTRATFPMENPPCVPHITPHTLCWNSGTWPKLHPSTSWPDRRRRGMGSQSNPVTSILWTTEETTILGQIAQLPRQWQYMGASWKPTCWWLDSGLRAPLARGCTTDSRCNSSSSDQNQRG